jgi:hypothetical protein
MVPVHQFQGCNLLMDGPSVKTWRFQVASRGSKAAGNAGFNTKCKLSLFHEQSLQENKQSTRKRNPNEITRVSFLNLSWGLSQDLLSGLVKEPSSQVCCRTNLKCEDLLALSFISHQFEPTQSTKKTNLQCTPCSKKEELRLRNQSSSYRTWVATFKRWDCGTNSAAREFVDYLQEL